MKKWLLYPKIHVGSSTEGQYSLGIKGQVHFPVGVSSLFTLKLQISVPLPMGKAGAPTSLFMLQLHATSAL